MAGNQASPDMVTKAKDETATIEDVDAGPPDMEKPAAPNHLYVDPERRAAIEKRLKYKLDLRCSLFVLI